ncbi:hypothetical protein LXA43DRAFT_226782 [Ganoderma leucocontextum]|nr:hypothetical protein LXA43DRAFT_226782 [Ganoderma leucocontextum]
MIIDGLLTRRVLARGPGSPGVSRSMLARVLTTVGAFAEGTTKVWMVGVVLRDHESFDLPVRTVRSGRAPLASFIRPLYNTFCFRAERRRSCNRLPAVASRHASVVCREHTNLCSAFSCCHSFFNRGQPALGSSAMIVLPQRTTRTWSRHGTRCACTLNSVLRHTTGSHMIARHLHHSLPLYYSENPLSFGMGAGLKSCDAYNHWNCDHQRLQRMPLLLQHAVHV